MPCKQDVAGSTLAGSTSRGSAGLPSPTGQIPDPAPRCGSSCRESAGFVNQRPWVQLPPVAFVLPVAEGWGYFAPENDRARRDAGHPARGSSSADCSPCKAYAPVAQSGQSAALRMRKSGVQIPPGALHDGGRSSNGGAPGCGPGGREFNPRRSPLTAPWCNWRHA